MIEVVNYAIQKSARSKVIVVHADKLKRCHSITPESWLQISQKQLLSLNQNEYLSNELDVIEPLQTRTRNDQLNSSFVDSDHYQENGMNIRNKRENRCMPKRFNDYQM